ncbi:MAG: GNAT family N-acetyltransferase [Firmicutes bacterium]|nr:GNAT family N-acetyltransferase [Bacillota bacterium]
MTTKNETWRDTDIIETERLRLVPWEDTDADAEAIYEIAKNPNVGPPAGWKPHESLEESRRILRELFLPFGNGSDGFSIRLKDTGRVIGNIAVYEDSAREGVKSLEVGYWLDEKEWHKGYMTEACKAIMDYAFLKYDLAVMSIRTSEVNFRSQGVIRNCGFTYEGTLRKAYHIYTGEDRDSRLYSITREEWEAK